MCAFISHKPVLQRVCSGGGLKGTTNKLQIVSKSWCLMFKNKIICKTVILRHNVNLICSWGWIKFQCLISPSSTEVRWYIIVPMQIREASQHQIWRNRNLCCLKTDDIEFLELSSVFLSLRIQSEFSRLTSEQMEELRRRRRNGTAAEWRKEWAPLCCRMGGGERESAEMGLSWGG